MRIDLKFSLKGLLIITFSIIFLLPAIAIACDAGGDGPPLTQGYWYRQCLAVPAAEGGIDPGRNGLGPKMYLEPDFTNGIMACANNDLEILGFFGTPTCEGLNATPPNDKCEKAIKQLTAMVLNVCSDRITDGCSINVQPEGCQATTVGGLKDEIASLIIAGDCEIASDCAAAVNEDIAFVDP